MRINDYHGPDGPGRRQNCCLRALNQAATRSADLLRRSFKCLISQDENQKSYLQDTKITSIGDTKARILDTEVGNLAQERKIISMRWLTMALNIIRLEKYVETCRMLKNIPDPVKLNASCTCILTMRKDLISHHPDSNDYEPGTITTKRALKNLRYTSQHFDHGKLFGRI